jgi:hypothetical protein
VKPIKILWPRINEMQKGLVKEVLQAASGYGEQGAL